MARVLVVADSDDEAVTFMDETVLPIHLTDEHSREQITERIGWAVRNATLVEGFEGTGGLMRSVSY